ncbi:MAG: phosphotransferase [bacterium]|nr:phosphotransferase [bacterium]
MIEKINRYYRDKRPDEAQAVISDWQHIADGMENEVYSYTLGGPERARGEIIKIYPGDDGKDKSANEFSVMTRLYEAGFPVPKPVCVENRQSPIGKPFLVMEKIDGSTLFQLMKQAGRAEKKAGITRFCQLMADLHQLDWQKIIPDAAQYRTDNPCDYMDRILKEYHDIRSRFDITGFDPLLQWLEERKNTVPCSRLSLLHGDFLMNNILVDSQNNHYVIDWGGARVSDPRVELAHTLVTGMVEGRSLENMSILQQYKKITRSKVENLQYFEALAALRKLGWIYLSIADDAGSVGMNLEAKSFLKRNTGYIKNVMTLIRERTGIDVSPLMTQIEA